VTPYQPTARPPKAGANIDGWVGELIWRDFYQGLLVQAPRVAHEPFLEAGTSIAYRDDPAGYRAWCEGRTGYPLVDAGIRQLRATGWMHPRVRLIAASFLCFDLGVDWRVGLGVTLGRQGIRHTTRIVDVHLAAVGADLVGARGADGVGPVHVLRHHRSHGPMVRRVQLGELSGFMTSRQAGGSLGNAC